MRGRTSGSCECWRRRCRRAGFRASRCGNCPWACRETSKWRWGKAPRWGALGRGCLGRALSGGGGRGGGVGKITVIVGGGKGGGLLGGFLGGGGGEAGGGCGVGAV